MAKLSYYLATSIDGYLARKDGSVDWLNPFQEKLNTPFDFVDYYKTVSTVLMGRKTWEVSKSFEEAPFADKKRIVVSKTMQKSDVPADCQLVDGVSLELINHIKRDSTDRVWLVGGAMLAGQLIEMGSIDEIVQTIVPVMIGSGIHWLPALKGDTQWQLSATYKAQNGLVQLIYDSKQ